jgi:hypothetical protein
MGSHGSPKREPSTGLDRSCPTKATTCNSLSNTNREGFGGVSTGLPQADEPEPEGKSDPTAVRANLDDPRIHIRPTTPPISGCKTQEPFRFRPLRREGIHGSLTLAA